MRPPGPLRTLFPYLWNYRGRIAFTLGLMLLAKLANVSVPLLLKRLVDGLNVSPTLLVLPVGLLLAYGAARLSTTVFTELRQLVRQQPAGELLVIDNENLHVSTPLWCFLLSSTAETSASTAARNSPNCVMR